MKYTHRGAWLQSLESGQVVYDIFRIGKKGVGQVVGNRRVLKGNGSEGEFNRNAAFDKDVSDGDLSRQSTSY